MVAFHKQLEEEEDPGSVITKLKGFLPTKSSLILSNYSHLVCCDAEFDFSQHYPEILVNVAVIFSYINSLGTISKMIILNPSNRVLTICEQLRAKREAFNDRLLALTEKWFLSNGLRFYGIEFERVEKSLGGNVYESLCRFIEIKFNIERSKAIQIFESLALSAKKPANMTEPEIFRRTQREDRYLMYPSKTDIKYNLDSQLGFFLELGSSHAIRGLKVPSSRIIYVENVN